MASGVQFQNGMGLGDVRLRQDDLEMGDGFWEMGDVQTSHGVGQIHRIGGGSDH